MHQWVQEVFLTVGGCPRLYDVCAVVSKSGNSADGHYVCVARVDYALCSRWWLVDDEHVMRAEDWGRDEGGSTRALEDIVAPPRCPLSDLPLFRSHAAVVLFCALRR